MRVSIQQYLGVPDAWKIREKIKHEIVLIPNRLDISNARKKDPKGCALRNTACRIFDVPNAAIGGRWAYIPQRDNKGRMYIARMQATAATQKALREFDTKGTMPVAGFRFVPIRKSHTYEVKRAYMKKWNRGEVGGKGKTRPVQVPRMKKTRTIPMNVRTVA